MNNFKPNDSVVVLYYSYNKNNTNTVKFITLKQRFEPYCDEIYIFLNEGPEALYKIYVHQIKNINLDSITLSNGLVIHKKDFKYIYSIEEVKEHINLHYKNIANTYSKILSKSLEIKALANDIVGIADAAGIKNICNSNIFKAINPIESSIKGFGWNTSSLSC